MFTVFIIIIIIIISLISNHDAERMVKEAEEKWLVFLNENQLSADSILTFFFLSFFSK